MKKIILISYEELEIYLNKPWYSFLSPYKDKFVFVFNDSKKIIENLKTKTLLDLIWTLNIEDFKEFWEKKYLKETMKDFYLYWTAKNDWWIKERRQMEKVFDVWQRFRTFLRNGKKFNKNIDPNEILYTTEI